MVPRDQGELTPMGSGLFTPPSKSECEGKRKRENDIPDNWPLLPTFNGPDSKWATSHNQLTSFRSLCTLCTVKCTNTVNSRI